MWAGKDTIAEKLARGLSIPLLGVSNVLREMAAQQWLWSARDDLRELSNTPGTVEALEQMILDRLSPIWMLVGIRIPDLYSSLQNKAKTCLIWVEAPNEVRMERITKRNKPWDPHDLEILLEFEAREYKHGNKLNIDALHDSSDYTIDNAWDLIALGKELEKATLRLKNFLIS